MCAVDASTGTVSGAGRWRRRRFGDVALQGYALLSATNVYFPAGRSSPYAFSRGSGSLVGQFRSGDSRGTFALLTDSSTLVSGPSSRGGAFLEELDAARPARDRLATYDGGNSMVVTSTRSYLLGDTTLTGLRRSDRSVVWRRQVECPYEVILAGGTLFAGGRDEVMAFDAASGETVWTSAVDGRAYGLAFAGGTLFVSTDKGVIHAFGGAASGERFVRGDANADDRVDLSDAVAIVRHLFSGVTLLACEDRGDTDDNGRVEITDAIRLLDFLFRAGRAPELPFPDVGVDPTADGIPCGEAGVPN